MTAITPISPAAREAASAAASSTSISSTTGLAQNFDTFIRLLTTQLQNQDPLDPMDTNQFTDQLTQFGQVEQAMEQTELLERLNELTRANAGLADLGFLGREVETSGGQIGLKDGQAVFDIEKTSTAEKTEIRIFDQSGKLIQRIDASALGDKARISWDGSGAKGQVPDGAYFVELVAPSEKDEEARIAGRVIQTARVAEVTFEGGETRLALDNGISLSPDAVRAVR